jgi:hypothetical protein
VTVPGLEVLVGFAIATATLSLYFLLRRERLRGEASTTHPLLVGLYRGLAFVLIVFVAYVVLAAFVLPKPWVDT